MCPLLGTGVGMSKCYRSQGQNPKRAVVNGGSVATGENRPFLDFDPGLCVASRFGASIQCKFCYFRLVFANFSVLQVFFHYFFWFSGFLVFWFLVFWFSVVFLVLLSFFSAI